MNCFVCGKVMPNRQTRWRKLSVMETDKFGKREKTKLVHRKCRGDFIAKHKILRAAGLPHLLPPEKVNRLLIIDDPYDNDRMDALSYATGVNAVFGQKPATDYFKLI